MLRLSEITVVIISTEVILYGNFSIFSAKTLLDKTAFLTRSEISLNLSLALFFYFSRF